MPVFHVHVHDQRTVKYTVEAEDEAAAKYAVETADDADADFCGEITSVYWYIDYVESAEP